MAQHPPASYDRPPPQPPPYYEKSYLGEAFIALVLYWVGFWIVGLVANIIFLNNAKRDHLRGIMTTNVGCLQILLWVQIIGLVVSCVLMIVFGGFGMLAALMEGGF